MIILKNVSPICLITVLKHKKSDTGSLLHLKHKRIITQILIIQTLDFNDPLHHETYDTQYKDTFKDIETRKEQDIPLRDLRYKGIDLQHKQGIRNDRGDK